MPQCPDLPEIDTTVQYQTVTFDFGPLIAANCPSGTVITAVTGLTCVARIGSDPSSQSRLIGSPQIGTACLAEGGSGMVNCAVLQQVGNVVGGVGYLLQCWVNVSSGDVPSLWVHFQGVTPN